MCSRGDNIQNVYYIGRHLSFFPGSKYRDLISNAILKLQEDQTLQVLYDKWWKQKGALSCAVDDKGKDANALAINNVGGVFVVLAVGIVLSVIVALAEFAYKSRQEPHHNKVTTATDVYNTDIFYKMHAISTFC